MQGDLFYKFQDKIMVGFSPYTILGYIAVYSSNDRLENRFQ